MQTQTYTRADQTQATTAQAQRPAMPRHSFGYEINFPEEGISFPGEPRVSWSENTFGYEVTEGERTPFRTREFPERSYGSSKGVKRQANPENPFEALSNQGKRTYWRIMSSPCEIGTKIVKIQRLFNRERLLLQVKKQVNPQVSLVKPSIILN